VNVLPWSGTERTVMSPPSSRANCRLIVSPSPVPPNRRVVLTSACTNGWKSLPCSASVIPTPSSTTSNRTVASVGDGPSQPTRSVIDPAGVNLTALPIRLISTCRSRSGSVRPLRGTGVANSSRSVNPFSIALGRVIDTASAASRGRSAGVRSTVIPPASILDRSSTSLITCSRCCPFRRIDCKSFRRDRWSRVGSSIRSAYPMMAAIGVRISWLMFARNSLLARLAPSAASLRRASSRPLCRACVSPLMASPATTLKNRSHRSTTEAMRKP